MHQIVVDSPLQVVYTSRMADGRRKGVKNLKDPTAKRTSVYLGQSHRTVVNQWKEERGLNTFNEALRDILERLAGAPEPSAESV